MVKSAIKTHAKKVLQAVEEKNLEKAREALTEAIPAIQRASLKKVLHKKTASRKISRLARSINALRVPA